MKKHIALILALVLILSLFGCKGNSTPSAGATDPSVTTEPTHEHDHSGETANTTEGPDATDNATEATEAPTESTTEPTEESTEPSTETPTEATEETTEPTEETTEPTEEATEPTTGEYIPDDPGDIGSGGVPDTPGQTGPTGHQHTYTSKTVAPTCESRGYTEHTCACGHSYKSNETKATGHKYNKTEVAPTCGDIGYFKYTCTCGDWYTEGSGKGATGKHNFVTKTVKPTENSEGYDQHVCSDCGSEYRDNYVPATGNKQTLRFDWKTQTWVPYDCNAEGHVYDNSPVLIKSATCCDYAIFEKTCSVKNCGYKEQYEATGAGKNDHTRSVNDIGEITGYRHSYEVRTSSGASTYFSDEAQWKAFARQIVNDFKSGKSTEYVHRLRHDYIAVRNTPKEFVCTTCGQTISNGKFIWDGQVESGLERIYEEYFTKENQPDL